MEPDILMLDEPFKGLDGATRRMVHKLLLRRYQKNVDAVRAGKKPGMTVLMIDHYNEDLVICSDRVIAISQDWNWRAGGFEQSPGSTVVYDKPAPVFGVNERQDAADIELQAIEMSEALKSTVTDPNNNRTFWQQVEAGQVQGVLAR